MMQHLFTYGPVSFADAENVELKETEIGMVPEEWDVKKCEGLCDKITVGVVVRPASYYVPSGRIALRSLNIREDYFDLNEVVYFSDKDNDTILSKSKLLENDVVIVRTGYPGTSCVVPKELEGANCIDLVYLLSCPEA